MFPRRAMNFVTLRTQSPVIRVAIGGKVKIGLKRRAMKINQMFLHALLGRKSFAAY